MPRYRIDVEYDGGPYAGWQRQAGQHSAQEAIEKAIAAFSGEDVTLRGAGRTDAGVHALGQVAHFDLEGEWKADTVRDAANAHLTMAGETVSILSAAAVTEDFDARFSAKARHYLYRILNRRAPAALESGRVWHVSRKLDVSRLGEEIEIRASARSFLHNQVRSLVGTLKKVGEGGWTVDDVEKALKARDRTACGPVAPPEGLYLVRVDY